jgi:hypothetical protein
MAFEINQNSCNALHIGHKQEICHVALCIETAMADHCLHNFWPSKEEIANKEVEICVEVMPENYHNQSSCGAYPTWS